MTAAMLPGIDRAAFAVALAMRLRQHGVAVDMTGIEAFTRALALRSAQGDGTRSELYWLARITLLRRQPDLAAFDQVFAAVFDEVVLRLDPNARRRRPSAPRADDVWAGLPDAGSGLETDGGGLPWATLPAPISAAQPPGDSELGIPQRLASRLEGLADTPFDQFTEADLELLDSWFETARRDWPTRRSRRMVTHPAGRTIALRPTLALARRTGWEPIELVRTRQLRRPRRVVMLCDVSQSMQAYAAAY